MFEKKISKKKHQNQSKWDSGKIVIIRKTETNFLILRKNYVRKAISEHVFFCCGTVLLNKFYLLNYF